MNKSENHAFFTECWAVPDISGIERSKCQKSKHELEAFSKLQKFEKYLKQKKLERFQNRKSTNFRKKIPIFSENFNGT